MQRFSQQCFPPSLMNYLDLKSRSTSKLIASQWQHGYWLNAKPCYTFSGESFNDSHRLWTLYKGAWWYIAYKYTHYFILFLSINFNRMFITWVMSQSVGVKSRELSLLKSILLPLWIGKKTSEESIEYIQYNWKCSIADPAE